MRPLISPSAIRLTALRTELTKRDGSARLARIETVRSDRSRDRWLAKLRRVLRLRGYATTARAVDQHGELAGQTGWDR